MSHIIENFYGDIEDPESLLTSSEALNCIVQFEKTVEVIGIVDNVETKEGLFKFTICNLQGDVVQVLAWGNDALRIQGMIKMNFITHIDAAFAKKKNTMFSLGTIKFDLHIMSNTTINVLKKISNDLPTHISVTDAKLVAIEDVMNVTGIIAVRGYLNSAVLPMVGPNATYGQTCILNNGYKLEIRVQQYEKNAFTENMHVEAVGKIYNSSIPYLLLQSNSSIRQLSQKQMSIEELITCTKVPIKRKRQQNTNVISSNQDLTNLTLSDEYTINAKIPCSQSEKANSSSKLDDSGLENSLLSSGSETEYV